MILNFLIFIKHRCKFIWTFIEGLNGFFVGLLYRKNINRTANEVLNSVSNEQIEFRLVMKKDLPEVCSFFSSQPVIAYQYFKPHNFDISTMKSLLKNPSFLMMGVFDKQRVVGYFFLRFFINKHSFTGYLVDSEYQGRGIAKMMGRAMFKIAWENDFRTFATVSQDNIRAIATYKAINDFKIVKQLPDNYIYIEYLESKVK
ncbi:MAG: GNAT family N-acetyltransferase [Odoribacter sp.]